MNKKNATFSSSSGMDDTLKITQKEINSFPEWFEVVSHKTSDKLLDITFGKTNP